MTTESIRIAIATACGTLNLPTTAEKIEHLDWRGEDVGCYFLAHYKDGSARPGYTGEIPDYLNDLNTRSAMLEVIVDRELTKNFEQLFADKWHALAVHQRDFCEIFLRTIGKYIDP